MAYQKIWKKRNFSKKKSYGRKKKSSSKRRRFNQRGNNLSQPRPFPKTFLWNSKYVDFYNSLAVTGVAGTIGVHSYRLNSMYDQDATGGGHADLGYEQMRQLYTKYCVVGAKVKIQIHNRQNDAELVVCFKITEDAVASNTPNRDVENGSMKYIVLSENGNTGDRRTMYVKWSAKKFFNTPNLLQEEKCSAVMGADPLRPCFLHVYAFALDSTKAFTTDPRFLYEADHSTVFHKQLEVLGSTVHV